MNCMQNNEYMAFKPIKSLDKSFYRYTYITSNEENKENSVAEFEYSI